MKTLRQFLHSQMRIVLVVVAVIFLLSQSQARAQSIGPTVDECTGGWVDPYGYVYQITCLLGNGSELDASNEVDSYNWSYVPEVDSQTAMSDGDNTFAEWSGFAVQNLGEQGGTDAYTGLSTTPNLNDVYSMSGEFGYCYDSSGLGGQRSWDDNPNDVYCIWNYPASYSQIQGVVTLPGSQGLLYPKYMVVGVTYAPPGAGPGPFGASTVQYTGTTAIGTTSTNSSSFSNDLGYTIQVSDKFQLIPPGATNPDGSVTIGTSQSTDYTQTQNTASTVTFNKSVSLSDSVSGYPTTYPSIGTPPPALPNDYDVIWLWLNPEMVYTAYPAAGASAGFIEWSGYAYDPNAGPGMDIYPVQVGCLNGDFTAANCSAEQGVLNRTWVQNEKSPTTGTPVSPAILPNTQDAYNILAADPFAYYPGAPAYPPIDVSQTTTPDGRFTELLWGQTSCCPNPVFYEPDGREGPYSITQMNTQQQSQGGSTQVKMSVSVSGSVSTMFSDIFTQTTTWTVSDTVIQTNTWLNTLSQQQTIQDAFTIDGSDPPNYVPGQFIAYQDNWYGTFMFYPWQ